MSNKTKLRISVASLALLLASPALAEFNEAPMLTDMVTAGKLPPIAERLPMSPEVVEGAEVGVYGGTWRSALKGNNDEGWIRRSSGYDPLVRYSVAWDRVIPNIAESWEANEEATRYTFKLRAGHRWSDGKPFTSEDVVFAINDVINHPEYNVGVRPPSLLGATASAPDATTVIVDLPKPNGMLLEALASVDGTQVVQFQKTFCSQFHPDYNENANKDATDAGLSGWGEAVMNNCGVRRNRNADRPTLYAWDQVDDYDGLNSQVRFERNPYYFKVDKAGNQLPYMDNLQMTQVEDANSIVLMGIAGELDMTNRHIDKVANKPVFFDNQEKGGYSLYSTVPADMNTAVIQLNLNYDDDGFRDLFQNRDFRVALSIATDREEIVDVVYAGQGEPFQAAPRPESPFYDEKMAKQYTEFDPYKANEMLDAIGLTERDDNGIRKLADGRSAVIRVDVSTDLGPQLDILELVQLHWEEVGIKLDVRKAERSYVYEQKDTNKHMAHVWKGDGGLGDAQLDPRYYLPMHEESAYAILWAKNWFEPSAADVQKLPEAVQKQYDAYRAMFASPNEAERTRLFKEVLRISQEQFYTIGISLPPLSYGVATNVMGNVPKNQPHAWVYPNPGPMNTSLLFKRQ